MHPPSLWLDIDDRYCCLEVTGEEATDFLHNQLPIDLRTLPLGVARWTAWCDARGRVRATFHIWRHTNTHWRLLCPSAHLSLLMLLRRYLLRTRAQIDSVPCPLVRIQPPAPVEPGAGVRLDAWRSLLTRDATTASELRAATDRTEVWQAACALAGEAQIPTSLLEQHIPQSLGFAPGRGLDLSKGCYPGQEIVARVHYRGRPPWRLHTRIGPEPLADSFFAAPLAGRTDWIVSQRLLPNRPTDAI